MSTMTVGEVSIIRLCDEVYEAQDNYCDMRQHRGIFKNMKADALFA